MIKKITLAQWLAIITLVGSGIGYIIHIELNHDQYVINLDRSVRQRDSIIQAMGFQNQRMSALEKKLDEKIASDDRKEDAEDVRLDKIETDAVVEKTRREDFDLFIYKIKTK